MIMNTTIASEKIVIISDLHLGNPFCRTKSEIFRFMREKFEEGYDICINGDVIDIAQVSFEKIAIDAPDLLYLIQSYTKKGRSTYYTIGNHDMVLENFLNDWGNFQIVPFLNLKSGGALIRVEHGHLFDPRYIRNPEFYEFLTRIAGYFLAIHPAFYYTYIYYEKMMKKMNRRHSIGIPGEPAELSYAAFEYVRRGFDHIVFGHTHIPGLIELEKGKTYVNPGSWLTNRYYVEVNQGNVELKQWTPKAKLKATKQKPNPSASMHLEQNQQTPRQIKKYKAPKAC